MTNEALHDLHLTANEMQVIFDALRDYQKKMATTGSEAPAASKELRRQCLMRGALAQSVTNKLLAV